jgi:type IV pilus assembly protein PilC
MGYVSARGARSQRRDAARGQLRRKKRVKLKDLSVFARQFATMIEAGLTMLRALTNMSEQGEAGAAAGAPSG